MKPAFTVQESQGRTERSTAVRHDNAGAMREKARMAALNEQIEGLHDAASAPELIMDFFRERGCADLASSICTSECKGWFPIHYAIGHGAKLGIIEYIMDAAPQTLDVVILGAAAPDDPDGSTTPRRPACTILGLACQFNRLDVVRLLISKGDEHTRTGPDEHPPILIACTCGFLDIVECSEPRPPA